MFQPFLLSAALYCDGRKRVYEPSRVFYTLVARYLLRKTRTLMDLSRLLFPLPLKVIKSISIAFLMKLYVISLRLHDITRLISAPYIIARRGHHKLEDRKILIKWAIENSTAKLAWSVAYHVDTQVPPSSCVGKLYPKCVDELYLDYVSTTSVDTKEEKSERLEAS